MAGKSCIRWGLTEMKECVCLSNHQSQWQILLTHQSALFRALASPSAWPLSLLKPSADPASCPDPSPSLKQWTARNWLLATQIASSAFSIRTCHRTWRDGEGAEQLKIMMFSQNAGCCLPFSVEKLMADDPKQTGVGLSPRLVPSLRSRWCLPAPTQESRSMAIFRTWLRFPKSTRTQSVASDQQKHLGTGKERGSLSTPTPDP